jgi:hypothetical protein
MNVLEKDLEDMLFEHIDDFDVLISKGFEESCQRKYRQVNLGGYGIADIIGISEYPQPNNKLIEINIYELKKEEISVGTFLQALRYAKALSLIFEKSNPNDNIEFNIILVGKILKTNSDFIYLTDFYENLHLYTYSFDFHKGIMFQKHSGYELTNGNIPIDSSFFIELPF